MSEIDSGYDEKIPETVGVKYIFKSLWEKPINSVHVDSETFDIYGNDDWGSFNKIKQKPNPCYDRNICRSLNNGTEFINQIPDERSFIYMDVGRWGGEKGKKNSHRDFGIVCGCHAVLCQFNGKSSMSNIYYATGCEVPHKKFDQTVEKIFRFLRDLIRNNYSVTIIKWESIYKDSLSDDAVNIFLGDLHLPIYIKDDILDDFPGKITGIRVPTRVLFPLPPSPLIPDTLGAPIYDEVHTESEKKEWFKNYLKGRIFPGGEDDLVDFLTKLEILNSTYNVHFFQLGDMYELWIGLDRYYEDHGKLEEVMPGRVKFRSDKLPLECEEFVNYYIRQANKCFPTLTKKLKNLKVHEVTYLYGNHDCYLGLDTMYNPIGDKRPRKYKKNNIYCEHGHWVDDWNYDGQTSGHRMTLEVYEEPWIRSWEHRISDRRRLFIAGAALEFYKEPDFSFFVMGHTHLPYLTKIIIENELNL